jgi:hypothetical protein
MYNCASKTEPYDADKHRLAPGPTVHLECNSSTDDTIAGAIMPIGTDINIVPETIDNFVSPPAGLEHKADRNP